MDEDPQLVGRRKDGKPYKEDNTCEDGSYAVGRNRAPKEHQFAVGDGRKRGRRPKGVRNADTEFMEELNRKVSIKEEGKTRRVTKGHATDIRLIDNAYAKGQNSAIALVDERRRRIAEKSAEAARRQTQSDQELLDAYLRDRAAELGMGLELGDPEPPIEDGGVSEAAAND